MQSKRKKHNKIYLQKVFTFACSLIEEVSKVIYLHYFFLRIVTFFFLFIHRYTVHQSSPPSKSITSQTDSMCFLSQIVYDIKKFFCLYQDFLFTPKIIKSYTIHPEILHIVFLALKTYLIPFFPHCPPYTSWDNTPSSLIVVLPILIQQFRSCTMFLGFISPKYILALYLSAYLDSFNDLLHLIVISSWTIH